jgi:maleylacetoacetate isomerase/maleylpyruvate isomerase
VAAWIATWVGQGLSAVEAHIGDDGFCFGPEPMLVDVFLLPQLCAARRFDVPLEAYPRILRVEKVAGEHPAFLKARPAIQPDAE